MILTMAPKKKTSSAPQPPANIHDVAERAGVAISSISRVLSGHPDVSERMRAKVEAAAAELGYEPDFTAQSLRSKMHALRYCTTKLKKKIAHTGKKITISKQLE